MAKHLDHNKFSLAHFAGFCNPFLADAYFGTNFRLLKKFLAHIVLKDDFSMYKTGL